MWRSGKSHSKIASYVWKLDNPICISVGFNLRNSSNLSKNSWKWTSILLKWRVESSKDFHKNPVIISSFLFPLFLISFKNTKFSNSPFKYSLNFLTIKIPKSSTSYFCNFAAYTGADIDFSFKGLGFSSKLSYSE